MASASILLFRPNLSNPPSFSSRTRLASLFRANTTATSRTTSYRPFLVVASASSSALQALIFDCDGVILESEHLHRQAYNDAFEHFNVRCPSSSFSGPLNWSLEFYDELQNLIGGGKPKMRYFKEHGWPTSTIFYSSPESDDDRAKLLDILQDWKTERYKEIIKSGTVEARPGVLRLMDEAKAACKKVAVCSAATKSSVILCLENLIGMERFQGLDCFLAGMLAPASLDLPIVIRLSTNNVGSDFDVFATSRHHFFLKKLSRHVKTVVKLSYPLDNDCSPLITSVGDDVKEKKPDPSIYITAAMRLNVLGKDCLVVEDSVIGLQAATGAGMSCVISYTASTAKQDFKEAAAIYPDLSDVQLTDLEALLKNVAAAK